MGEKLNDILKQNAEMKAELERIVSIARDNEAKRRGFATVQHAFLLAESLEDVADKPLTYLEDIFDIDRAMLFIHAARFDAGLLPGNAADVPDRIRVVDGRTFEYFFIEKRPYQDTGDMHLISEFKEFSGIGSWLIAPVIDHGRIIGSLNLYARDKDRFGRDDVGTDFVRELSVIISVSLAKMHNAALLTRQALIDGLTECFNKTAMHEFIASAVNAYERYDRPFAFIMLDVDNFKAINDAKGHLVGDEVISELSAAIKPQLRASDIFGRFGGDEFYLIVPVAGEDAPHVDDVCRKLGDVARDVFAKHGFKDVASISGGVVIVPEDFPDGAPEGDAVVKLADDRLYQGKKAGKGTFIGVNNDRIKNQ